MLYFLIHEFFIFLQTLGMAHCIHRMRTGIVFATSLTKHLYPNFHDVTDFYRVQSMRGVFLASQIQEDNSIQTKITFNRGGDWHAILRPVNVPLQR